MSQMIDPHMKITLNKKTGYLSVETVNEEPSLTQQQFKDECDINQIIKKYETTGEFTHRTSKTGQYADFSEIKDYQTMLDTVNYAEQAFHSLPATVRARFENNPGQLLNFIQDSKNYDEGVSLGLLNPRATSITQQTPQSNSPTPTTPIPTQTQNPPNTSKT